MGSPDENVSIGFGAEHAQALSAIQAISDYLEKLGQGGKKAGESMGEAFRSHANKAMEEFTSGVRGALTISNLFETAIESVSERLKELADRGREAADMQRQLAGVQRGWQDYLKPGEDPAAIDKKLETIGAGGIGTKGASQAFAAAIANRREGTTVEQMLADVAEASKSTREGGLAGQRATQIRGLLRGNFGFTEEGAAAELASEGWSGDFTGRIEPGIEGLNRMSEGKDNRKFLKSFARSLGPKAEAEQMERVAKMIFQGTDASLGAKASLEERLNFLHSAKGSSVAAQMSGVFGLGDDEMIGKATGIRSPELYRPTQELISGRGLAADKLAAGLAGAGGVNDPSALAGAAKVQQAVAGQDLQRFADVSRVGESEAERLKGKDPLSYVEEAKKQADRALESAGYWKQGLHVPFMGGGTSVRARLEGAMDFYSGGLERNFNEGENPYLTPQDHAGNSQGARARRAIKTGAGRLRAEAQNTTGDDRDSLEKAAASLEKIEALLEQQLRNQAGGQKLTVQDGGDHHRATITPAERIGR